MPRTHRLTWTLVVPVKPLARAKSRLSGPTGPHRERLALAIATDTVSAVLRSSRVQGVVVVTDDPIAAPELAALGAVIVPDEPDSGLNAALVHGAAEARRRAPEGAVGALSADLPALRPGELDRVLAAAAAAPNAFLPDAAGIGTTLYTARPDAEFAPAFGADSRARHRTGGAHELTLDDVPSVRRDVDTIEDLRAALDLGVGPRTASVAVLLPVSASSLDGMQATVKAYDRDTRSGSVLLDDGTEMTFGAPAFDAGGLRLLRLGQRVNIAVDGESIIAITLSTFPLP
jgi:2-phospho-L-lactate/phosphoenolpyruvate guanylyltransferase